MSDKITRLTKADLESIEREVEQLAGSVPTADDLVAEGMTESTWLNAALDIIEGAGRVLTLAIVELVAAFGAPVLAFLLVLLESDRVYHGVLSLGQHADQALLVAVVLTAMNAVLPIYHLRNVTGSDLLTRSRWTVRGYLESFWRRLTARPQAYDVDVYSNPALAIAESTITWATLFLAFYAVMGPMLEQYESTVWYLALWALGTESSITEILGLLAGLLLSVGGVFGVQSISHELACRRLTDKPKRLVDTLSERRADHARRVDQVREDVRQRYMAAKLADQERKETAPFGSTAPTRAAHVATVPMPVSNGHTANGNGAKSVTK